MMEACDALAILRGNAVVEGSSKLRSAWTRPGGSGEPDRWETRMSGSEEGGWKHRSCCALAAYPTCAAVKRHKREPLKKGQH